MNEMNNRTMPPCTVMPVLVYPEVRQAVDWLCNAFGFVERWEAKGHRAQLLVGRGAVVVVDGDATGACGAHSMMVRVDNVDAHHSRRAPVGRAHPQPAGRLSVRRAAVHGGGPGGHRWTFSQSIADLAPEEWGGTSGPGMARG